MKITQPNKQQMKTIIQQVWADYAKHPDTNIEDALVLLQVTQIPPPKNWHLI